YGQVRVDAGGAVAGEVLDAGGHSGRLQPFDRGHGVPGDQRRFVAERAGADDRVVRLGVDVGVRRHVQVDAAPGQLRADRPVDLMGQLDVVHGAERRVPRVRAALVVGEPGDV